MTDVKVTQADREAAADALHSARPLLADEVRAGRMDDYAGVQAFARHRIAALESAAGVADLAEQEWSRIESSRAKGSTAFMASIAAASCIATAIRALIGGGSGN